MPPPNQVVDAEIVDDENEDATAVAPKEIIAFVLRAARARVPLVASVFVAVGALAVAANAFLPRTYRTEVRIAAQGQASVIRAFNFPGRPLPDIDSPTKGASETLLRRDSLVKIVRDARLLERWDESRPPLLRLKDSAVGLFAPPATTADKEAALIGLLEKRLTVVGEDQAVNIGVDWTSAAMAYEIVIVAQKTFIESRRAVEVAVISDAIALIEQRAKDQRPAVDAALKDMGEAYDAAKLKKYGSPAPAPGAAPAPAPDAPAPTRAPTVVTKPAEPDKELIEKLAEKRRTIAELEQTRQRRLSELKAQLEEQRATLGAAHPTLIATEKRLEAMSDEPPELIAARNEERAMLKQVSLDTKATTTTVYTPRNSGAGGGGGVTPPPTRPSNDSNEPSRLDEDPQVTYTHNRFDAEERKYEELMTSLDGARAELDNAKTAFKYRYSIARPAEVPKQAVKPKPVMILGGGFGLAFLLSLLIPAALRLLTGRVQEPWQVRTQLKLPVLGEVKLPSK